MKHAHTLKRAMAVMLALVLTLSLVTPTWAMSGSSVATKGENNGITWEKVESKQDKMAKTISKKALDGQSLDVVWNLTLATNIISANVQYGQIEKIEKIKGVDSVLIETQY